MLLMIMILKGIDYGKDIGWRKDWLPVVVEAAEFSIYDRIKVRSVKSLHENIVTLIKIQSIHKLH